MIERKATNRCTIIKVLNYSTYQDINEEMVNQPMNHQMNHQMSYQMDHQMNHNRTSKQEEQEEQRNNYPPKPPQRGSRRRSSSVRIETPDWYKRQQAGEPTPITDEDPEDIIADIERMKKEMLGE